MKCISTILMTAGFIGLFVFAESADTNVKAFLIGEGLSLFFMWLGGKIADKTTSE